MGLVEWPWPLVHVLDSKEPDVDGIARDPGVALPSRSRVVLRTRGRSAQRTHTRLRVPVHSVSLAGPSHYV